jgi:hypothetical protein
MMRWLTDRLIALLEKRLRSDMAYLRALNAASPRACRGFLRATALARHRDTVPCAVSHAARLAGVVHEYCGPCVQITVDQARAAGVSEIAIMAILTANEAAMPADIAIAYRFARAMLMPAQDLCAAREAVRRAWGEKGVVDLTFATQFSRLYPMLKRGLGYDHACRRITVGVQMFIPRNHDA